MTPSRVPSFARTVHRIQGNPYGCLLVSHIIRDMIKNTDEQSDEDIHRVRSGRVLRAGASVLVELGCTTLPKHRSIHLPRNSPNPILWGFFWRLHHVSIRLNISRNWGRDQYIYISYYFTPT